VRETFQVEKGSAREEVLLSAAQAGQEWAFAELCSRHARRTLFVLYKITKNREDAEDAFQDSVLKAFVHFGEFNRASCLPHGSRGSLSTPHS
jgi:RNA polymerase sigma-70 factor, ECF subfamily